jgi:hypothetical protein
MSFKTGFQKIAQGDAIGSARDIKDFTKGYTAGGPSLAQTMSNFKKAFGFGGGNAAPKPMAPPPAAPGNVGKMGG